MATIYNEEHRRQASARIVTIAQRILSGESGIVAGARQLARLRFDVGAEHDSDFIFFVAVDSESDDLPLGEVRSHWNADVLKEKDAELQKKLDEGYAALASAVPTPAESERADLIDLAFSNYMRGSKTDVTTWQLQQNAFEAGWKARAAQSRRGSEG